MIPVQQSPLHAHFAAAGTRFEEKNGWLVPQTAAIGRGVQLQDESHRGWIRIEGDAAAQLVDAAACAVGSSIEAAEAAHGRLFRLRPDLFFLLTDAPHRAVTDLQQAAAAMDTLITITDTTQGHAKIRVAGAQSRTLLSRVCGFDFHDRQFPDGAIRRSSVAKTAQTILREDIGAEPGFLLLGGRSFAVYLWQTLVQAGHDLDLTDTPGS